MSYKEYRQAKETRRVAAVRLERLGPELLASANELQAARSAEASAIARAKNAALAALATGATEVAVAEALGVNRLTIRNWQGK